MATQGTSLKKIKVYIQEYLEVLQQAGLPIERAYLFGSFAKGRSHRQSDIDVCVISRKFGKRLDAYEYLWTMRRDKDVRRGIEPVGFHPKEFVAENALVWEIKKNGIELFRNRAS